MNIIVIDHFYKDPEKIRSLALEASYKDVTQLNYPGFQSHHNYCSSDVIKKIELAINSPICSTSLSQTFGKFRIMLKETGSKLKVHLDGHSDWTGVLYLNPDSACQGGTGFYTHKKTGLDGPTFDSDWQQIEQEVIELDSLKPEAWVESSYVAMKFNRLVLFRGNQLFHCHTKSFGNNLSDARLTQNFFFNEAKNV
ncbi:MAG: 2OG-Fe(II) oxygenase [Bdellovibrionaceae bacterium]|nr:2OG-Fe(II) oxygenase [Bdellovibrio sp.]